MGKIISLGNLSYTVVGVIGKDFSPTCRPTSGLMSE
jgi:hypothetical protein